MSCNVCNGSGLIGVCDDEIVFCDCETGILAECNELLRQASNVVESLDNMADTESNQAERESREIHYQMLISEHDRLRSRLWSR